ncbi:MAG: ABC transporter substrate-binding protein [Syntrophales bacterium]
MTPPRRITVALIVAVVCGLVLAFFGVWPRGAGKEYAGPVEKITVGVARIEAVSLFYLAQERGFFKNRGLDVRMVEYSAGLLAADDLLLGRLDVATTSEFVAVGKHFLTPEVRILASISRPYTHEVIGRKDRGIGEPRHLRGKRIAVTRDSSGDFFLGTFLTDHGIPAKSVTFVDLPPPGILEALSAGTADAAMTWEPTVGRIKERLGANAVHWPGQGGRGYYFVLLTREAFIRERPRAAERLLRALIDAEEYAAGHTPQAQGFIASRLGYDLSLLQALWPRCDFRVRLDQDLLILMEDEARWAIRRRGLKREMPNYLDVVRWELLGKIRPEAVTVIH